MNNKILAHLGSKLVTTWAFSLLVLVFGQPLLIKAQNILVDTKLVVVPLTALDRDGRYVADLRQSDFSIFEDGAEQKIEYFEPVQDKITILLLIDVSGSMVFDMPELTRAVNEFVRQLRPTDDLTTVTFSDHMETLFDIRSVADVRAKKKIQLFVDGRPPITAVHDAVNLAMKRMKKVKGRRAIVMFSDGIGKGFNSSAKSNLQDALEQDALVYTVNFDTNARYPTKLKTESEYGFQTRNRDAETARTFMKDLAHASGGRAFQIDSIDDAGRSFKAIADELSMRYTLGYYPTKPAIDGDRRKITVKVSVPNVVVRSRREVVYKKIED